MSVENLAQACADWRNTHSPGTPEKYPGAMVSVNLLELESLIDGFMQLNESVFGIEAEDRWDESELNKL